MNLFQRAKNNFHLTIKERALLKVLQGLLISAVVVAIMVLQQDLLNAALTPHQVLQDVAEALLFTFAMGVAKAITAAGEANTNMQEQAIGHSAELLVSEVENKVRPSGPSSSM